MRNRVQQPIASTKFSASVASTPTLSEPSSTPVKPYRKPGETMKLEVYRGSKKLTITVKLGSQPASQS